MALGTVPIDCRLKLHTGKQLQQLAEYATKYAHVRPSFGDSV
jgi:hypothetical protein